MKAGSKQGTTWYLAYRQAHCMLAILLLSLVSGPAFSAPTGADLRNACEDALASGFDSIEGQMCSWYVLPCDCYVNRDIPRVCLPDGIPVTKLATELITGIAGHPELEMHTATRAAAEVLSLSYPCSG